MSKKIIIKLVILLIVAALVYSVFWFFKVSQVEKQISQFVNKNSTYISVGEIAVSGFPLKQKITIKNLNFSIPAAALSGNQIIVKHLEAETGIFENDFTVSLKRDVAVQSLDGKTSIVEFKELPQISATMVEGMIAKVVYQDKGYSLYDDARQLVYGASSSKVIADIQIGSDEKITTQIKAEVKDAEGFDVVDIYNNAFEKGVIDGIKTGEIVLGNLPIDAQLKEGLVVANQGEIQVDGSSNVLPVPAEVVKTPEVASAAKSVEQAIEPVAIEEKPLDGSAQPAVKTADKVLPVAVPEQALDPKLVQDLQALNQELANPEEVATLVPQPVEIKPVKNSFSLDIAYILSPNNTKKELEIPTDPTKIQDIPVQYAKSIQINALKITNEHYSIEVAGNVILSSEDRMPSGSLDLKITNIDPLTQYLAQAFMVIATGKDLAIDEVQAVDLMENEVEEDNAYNDFLLKLSLKLSPVLKELSQKSEMTQGNIAHFNIKREKNLDFMINASSPREILGKF